MDWLDASFGEPCADVCRSYVLMHNADPALAQAYLEAWQTVSGQNSETVLAWLGVTAAARMAENVPHETAALPDMIRSSGVTAP